MTASLRRALALVPLVVLTSCQPPAPQLIVRVDATDTVAAGLFSVSLDVERVGSEGGWTQRFEYGAGRGLTLPFSFGIVAADGAGEVVVVGRATTTGGLIETRSVVRWDGTETMLVDVFFHESCATASCEEGTTCRLGCCVDEHVEALVRIEPGDELGEHHFTGSGECEPSTDACRPGLVCRPIETCDGGTGFASYTTACLPEASGTGMNGDPCETSADCETAHVCLGGSCARICDSSACSARLEDRSGCTCADDEQCLNEGFGRVGIGTWDAVSLCRASECDLSTGAGCAAGLVCYPIPAAPTFGACRPPGTHAEGSPCAIAEDCQPGLGCRVGATGATCAALCTSDRDCTNGLACDTVEAAAARSSPRFCNDLSGCTGTAGCAVDGGDCAWTERCDGAAEPFSCVTRTADLDLGEVCAADAECPDGSICEVDSDGMTRCLARCCDASACPDTHFCTYLARTETPTRAVSGSVCRSVGACDPRDITSCSDGLLCYVSYGSAPYCAQERGVGDGRSCGVPEDCGPGEYCASHTSCPFAIFGGCQTRTSCAPLCDPTSPDACGPGTSRECVRMSTAPGTEAFGTCVEVRR